MNDGSNRYVVLGRGLLLYLDATRHKSMIDTLRKRRFQPISVSRDGKRVLATHHSGPLFVFDLATGRRWGVKVAARATVAMSPSGRVLAWKNGAAITLWDIENARPIEVLRGHRGQVETLAFFADGKRLVSSSRDTTLLIWRVGTTRAAQMSAP